MPHVNDKRNRAECARLLGGPSQFNVAARKNGRRIIDTGIPGQQEFQALLLWCLLSPQRSIKWDTKSGRSFREMFLYYSWASPQPSLLASGWTVAPRVASYLLPTIRTSDIGEPQYSGIPGLRFDSASKRRLRLTHLPTGGIIDLYQPHADGASFIKELLYSEAGISNSCGREDSEALWTKSSLAPTELTELTAWPLVSHAPLLSAVMARINILWQHWGNRAELDINPFTGRPRLSWWAGPSMRSFVRLLTDSPIEIRSARWSHSGDSCLMLIVDDSRLELRGPGGDLD